ncbi:type IX secretion system plug protein domain-containing protein [Rhodohalobacter sp. 614A]|uniref:type IX secretion system plug protein n=1 Tax=Rhodohalobacter sp. 614A TaxID=2908649 RepID=UPI001F48A304|nr:type IX secretion system plug protein domain-containing protein [Rhodohalobacter sp. 614A]
MAPNTIARSLSILICTVLSLSFVGCGSLSTSVNQPVSQPENLFNIAPQIIAGDSIRSIQFHRVGNPSSAPILNLCENNQLQLQFENLSIDSKSYRVSLSHHNPDWSRSGLPPERFMEGFQTLPINDMEVSRNNRPRYRQYTFTFPTEQFQITKSGNYLLKVEDSDTGYLILSLPFFVSENAGALTSSVEEISVPRQNLRRMHRPVSQYSLPDFVEQPQFDLEFYFAQNRFWGRARQADELDFSAPDHVQFEVSQREAFIGDYEFNFLALNELSQTDNNVMEAYPAEVPPRLILRDDAEGFTSSQRINPARVGPFGEPDMNLNAGYANVVFRFDLESPPDSTTAVHLLGDFNNWSVSSNNQLMYDQQTDRWTANAIIKKGNYKYKYVWVDNEEIQDLYLDDQFVNNRQQYHAFVYMRDSAEFYYRLLQVQTFFSE